MHELSICNIIMNKYNNLINVDDLFPSSTNKSGTRGKKMDIDTLFSHTSMNNEPIVTFSSEVLLDKIDRRRKEKLNFFKQMLNYCHKRINDADDDQTTDIVFTVVDSIPECKNYNPRECLEYISIKLREEYFDTTILTDTTMFITWKYLELKKENIRNIHIEKNRKNDDGQHEKQNKNRIHLIKI